MASLTENVNQEKAISTTEGPLIIVSCPGSGKTTTMVRRIHHLIESGVPPQRIIMVTFARSASEDMQNRYRSIYGVPAYGVTFSTMHAMCNGIIRESGMISSGGVYDENQAREFLINAMSYYGSFIDDRYEMASQLLQEFSAMRNREIPLYRYEPKCCEKNFFDRMYTMYTDEKRSTGCIDFDDMIIMIRDRFRNDPAFLEYYRSRYDYIQCDEYQDTNSIQRDILYMLAGDRANLCVVGDDDQAIYRFRGTDSSIMMNFESDFKARGLGCCVVKMETNYRCMKDIVDMSAMCIKWNRNRIQKNFISSKGQTMGEAGRGRVEYIKELSQADETRRVIDIIKKRHEEGVPYNRIAVLYRKNKQATMPAQYLSAEGIPYYTEDKLVCIYDEWMFRDIRAYVEMSMGINVERNKMRVLNRPARYFTSQAFRGLPFTAEGMLMGIQDKKGNRKEDEWKYKSAEKAVFTWLNCFGPGKISADDPPSKIFERLSGKGSIQYDRYIKERAKFKNDDIIEVNGQFDELRRESERFATVREWFAHADRVRMMVARDSSKKDPEGVRLSTIHGAKGLEWNTVIVIGVNQHTIPGTKAVSPEDVEEERRILYVAMTRAEECLYITYYGQESEFMAQTVKSFKELKNPVIPKKLRGSPVVSRKYGKGRIQNYTKDRVLVSFPEYGVKKFRFPEAFVEGHLKYI